MRGTRRSDNGRDRGQLLLVAALVIGITLLALVVVWNGVLFTNTFAATETKQYTNEMGVSAHELEKNIPEYIRYANGDGHYDGVEMYEEIEEEVEQYSTIFGPSKSASGANTVEFELERTYDNDRGMIFRQDESMTLENSSRNEDDVDHWYILDARSDAETDIQHNAHFQQFEVALDLDHAESEPGLEDQDAFRFVVRNDTGTNAFVFSYEENNGEYDVTVEYYDSQSGLSDSPIRECTWADVEDEFDFDMLRGETSHDPGDCPDGPIDISLVEPGWGGYGLEVFNGHRMAGQYDIWTSNDNPHCLDQDHGDCNIGSEQFWSESNLGQPYTKWFMWEPVIQVQHLEEGGIIHQLVEVQVGQIPYLEDQP